MIGENYSKKHSAPMNLLYFLRWFKKNSNRPFSILLGNGGKLVADFEELAETWSMDRGQGIPTMYEPTF
jgi:hypothetical protein